MAGLTSDGGPDLGFVAHDLGIGSLLDLASLHAAGHHRPPTRDGERVLDGEEEGLVQVSLWNGDPPIHFVQQLQDGLRAQIRTLALKSQSQQQTHTQTQKKSV